MTRIAIVRLSVTVSLALTCGAGASSPLIQQSSSDQCQEPVPPGFRSLDSLPWSGPWVFDAAVPGQPPLNALDNSDPRRTNRALRIRLDDGSEGTLRIEQRACGPTEDCAPLDCGCPLADESYWIDVTNPRGAVVAHMHLWAAYGIFQVVPIDLVDGPGDELLIVRVPAHAAPPIGHDLKIWKIGATRPVVLADTERVAGLIGTAPIGCARWRTQLSVDRAAAKPRAILLRTEIGSTGCCRIADEEASRVTGLRRDRALQFEAALGRYVLR